MKEWMIAGFFFDRIEFMRTHTTVKVLLQPACRETLMSQHLPNAKPGTTMFIYDADCL
jgi:hypothetical protein